ncbi:MAG: rod shape-determining protein MreD [Candidatus Hydrogenedentota bacterium]
MANMIPMSWARIVTAVMVAIVASFIVEPVLGMMLPIAPAIPLCVVLAVGACNGPLFGVVCGMLTGFLVDLLGSSALGVNLCAMALVGYLAGRLVRIIPPWPDAVRVVVAAPLLFLYVPATWLLARLAGISAPLGGQLSALQPAAAFLVMNLIAAVLVSPFLSVLRSRR